MTHRTRDSSNYINYKNDKNCKLNTHMNLIVCSFWQIGMIQNELDNTNVCLILQ